MQGKYDLHERTLKFSKDIINLIKSLPTNSVNIPLVNQLIRSATSIGANYREANETETKKLFKYKISICRRESKETVYWLELLQESNPNYKREIVELLIESQQLTKIFAAIVNKLNRI